MIYRQPFDIFKMRAILKSFWVRKLIGKLGVPYNRGLRVRGSPHPHDYGAGLSLAEAESNALRIHSDLASSVRRIASLITLFSSGESRAFTIIPRNLAFATFGLPIFGFINTLRKTKIIVDKAYISFYD